MYIRCQDFMVFHILGGRNKTDFKNMIKINNSVDLNETHLSYAEHT
jgi:hypothetical protein